MLTGDEKDELESLRKSAYLFIKDPLEKICFELECLLDKPYPTQIERLMIKALIMLKDKK